MDDSDFLRECADMLESEGHNGNAERLREIADDMDKK